MDGPLPVWVRAPKTGHERFTGLTRPKLYELAGKNLIRSASLREPGQLRGCRLFNLKSILDFIGRCETDAGSDPVGLTVNLEEPNILSRCHQIGVRTILS
jgi:hypothetical protein